MEALNYNSLRSEIEPTTLVYDACAGCVYNMNESRISLYDVYEALGLECGLSREDTIKAKNWFFNN